MAAFCGQKFLTVRLGLVGGAGLGCLVTWLKEELRSNVTSMTSYKAASLTF
jgi:hypothetical protein